jgi:hypothetical protein
MLVTDQSYKKTWSIQVKTNHTPKGFWLVNSDFKELVSPTHIYLFINLRGDDPPDYYVVPSRHVATHGTKKVRSTGPIWYGFSRKFAEHYHDWSVFGRPPPAAAMARDKAVSVTAFDFASELMGAKTFSDFVELSTAHARKQFETLTAQSKELTALAQKVATETDPQYGRSGVLGLARRSAYSALMLAARMTLLHLSVSSAMSLPNSPGVLPNAVPPRSASRALNLGSARLAFISLLSFSTISLGVFFGAPTPCHALAS